MPEALWRQHSLSRARFTQWFKPSNDVVPVRDDPDVPGWEESIRIMHRELTVQFAQRESEIVDATKSFLPRIIQRPRCDSRVTVMHRCTGCVVFSDASGFTALTETLAQRADGAEVLSKCLNKFFTPLIDIIEAYRGDVIKFSGDALSILFEATDDYELHPCPCGSPDSNKKTPQQLACLRASACCLEIHKRLHNFDTGEGGVRLTLHIGVGAGNIALLQVGGEYGRYEYVIAGTPMEQISIAEPLAGSGETVLSPQTWGEVEYTVKEGEPLTEGPPGFHRLAAFDTRQHTYPTVKQAALECTRTEEDRQEIVDDRVLLKQSERFIPRAVLKHLRSGNSSSVNEMRSVTIIFVQIGGVDVSTENGSQVAQQLMLGMQRACYNLEGNLNKFLVDDKGLLFLFVFGLPPVVHIDDPARAIVACFEMVNLLKSMGLIGRFGVTTGRVFCGIVGSAKRREYTVMGDTVNLSARLMANAKENSVLIDEATFIRSERDIQCDKLKPIKVKGKAQPIQIYAPQPPLVHGLEVRELSSFLSQRGWNLDQTQLEVRNAQGLTTVTMPWRAASETLGGKSPLLKLKRWRVLQKVDQLLAGNHGLLVVGGALLLLGPTGIGKQELSEHLIHQGMNANLLPLFGYQRSRAAEQWRAVVLLIQNCLITLARAGHGWKGVVAEVAEKLLHKYVKPDEDLNRVLAFLGFEGFKVPSQNVGPIAEGTTDLMLEAGAVRIAVALVTAVAENSGVLVTLRIRRGTDIFDGLSANSRSSLFWRLSSELARTSLRRRREILAGSKLHPILVVTVARAKPDPDTVHPQCSPDDVFTRSGGEDRHPPVGLDAVPTPQREGQRPHELVIGPLTDDAAVELMCHCLGVSTADGGSLVKKKLREFIGAVSINVPAYIQDCIEQMKLNRHVSVKGGECKAEVADLNALNIAEWVHTSMVGGTISILESLGSAKQHIMKMATVFEGPFSALDLAATNRVLFGQLPKTLSFHDMAKLLASCSELVTQGLLNRVTLRDSFAADRAPAEVARWTISNTLVRRVAGSMVLNSYRILIKRAVLIERALNVSLPKRLGLTQGHNSKKRKQSKPGANKDSKAESSSVASSSPKSPFKPLESEKADSKPEEVNELFCTACVLGNLNLLLEIFENRSNFEVNFTASGGYTPLHFACSGGEADVVRLLCERGAQIDIQSDKMEGPLLIAAERGHLEVVQYLCETQRALTAGVRDNEYWERMLVELACEEDIPRPLSEVKPLPTCDHLTLNGKRREVFSFLMRHLQDGKDMDHIPGSQSVDSNDDSLGTSGINRKRVTLASQNEEVRPGLARSDSKISIGGDSDKTEKTNGTLHSLKEVFKTTISSSISASFSAASHASDQANKLRLELQGDDRQATAIVEVGKPSAGKKPVERRTGLFASWKAKVRSALRGKCGLVFMLVALGLALYMPDIWVSFGAPDNTGINVVLTIVMIAFLLELTLLSIVDSSYPGSFFFFMDCVGTISMIWDISFMLGSDATKPQENMSNESDLTLFRATRTAKIGARAGRLSRLVKIMRFLPGIGISRGKQDEAAQLVQISNRLTNVLSKRVACLTILLVIVLPLFTIGLYPEADFSMRVWIDALDRKVLAGKLNSHEACGSLGTEFQLALKQFASFYQTKAYGPYRICARGIGGADPEVCCDLHDSKFKAPERKSFQLDVSTSNVKASFNYSKPTIAESNMGIVLTSIVIVLMCSACLLLNYSASELAVRPLERMLASIKRSAKAIFSSVNSLEKEIVEETEEFDETLESEVELLEQVVKKIATLAELSSKRNPFDEDTMTGMKNEELGVLAISGHAQHVKRSDGNEHQDLGEQPAARNEVTVTMRWQLEEIGLDYETFNSWDFDPLDWEVPKQKAVATWMIMNNPGSSAFTEQNVDLKKIRSFIDALGMGYLPNPYHNLAHAVDVTHVCFRNMVLISAEHLFSMLEQYSLLVACLGHDLGHPGVNNGFLTETQDEIAIRYNDRSPLENMHCCKLFEISGRAGTDIFSEVSFQEYRDVRKLIIEVILHTDITQHPAMVKELELLYEMNARIFEGEPKMSEQQVELLSGDENKKLVGKLLLHGADISNPSMPWPIAHAWAVRVLNEYFAQGDQEKKLGIPLQMLNDRDKVNKPHSQIGFIEFIVAPLVAAEVKLFPAWREKSLILEENLKKWEQAWLEQEENPPEEAEREKVHDRVQKVLSMLGSSTNAQSTRGKRRKSITER